MVHNFAAIGMVGESTRDSTRDPGIPVPAGSADVRINIDQDTYDKLHAEYCSDVTDGYRETFAMYVFNRTAKEQFVTVDGVPIDPDRE